jgi:rhamnogalacturonan endolyase
VYVNTLAAPRPTTKEEVATLAATAGNPTVPASWTANANALWQDALAEAAVQRTKWPFEWVHGVDYPLLAQRATVTGQIVLDDPQAATKKLPHLTVGLTHPDTDPATIPEQTFRGVTYPPATDAGSWIHDARFYQFFADGSDDGRFTIPKVRPGKYTLHATADGVLGDYAKADITVEAGKPLELGKLVWKPVRYGRQLWELGYPDRAADEFFKGDPANVWLWGWNLRYALLFPHDVTFTIGKSDPHKDWFFEEVPHADSLAFVNPEAKDPANQRFGWVKAESLAQYPQSDQQGPWRVYGKGHETVWTLKFNVAAEEKGTAALRVAFAGVNGMRAGLPVTLNGQSIGAVGDGSSPINQRLINTDAIRYNTDKGLWQQRTLKFDATLLHAGENVMTFTVPAGDLSTGVVWDYLRLEVDESAKP